MRLRDRDGDYRVMCFQLVRSEGNFSGCGSVGFSRPTAGCTDALRPRPVETNLLLPEASDFSVSK